MIANMVDNIKRLMGWCPNETQSRYKSSQHVDFVNTSQNTSGRSNVENVQSKNVMFSSNTTLLITCFVICLNLVSLVRNMDYTILIPILVVIYSLLYFIVARSLKTNVSIDENGVHLKSYEFSDITLDYKDIKSVTPGKTTKCSIEIIVLLAISLTFIVALLAYLVIAYGDWRLIISLAPLLPGYLFFKYGQDMRYHDVDVQLSIRSENKNRYTRWFEITSNYSIVTDEVTAFEIQDAIEHYRGAK
ncbi:MAG: DUF1673 domain-containing protein [Methanosarcinales archaeon]|nr:DUF1673 domain-containing protein [Methanosarcinales archaeon]